MIKRELLGHEMWECSSAEAKKVWFSQPDDRWRIMTQAEFSAHLLDDPPRIEAWITKKRAQPGEYL